MSGVTETIGVTGWDRLRHGGLLLDAERLRQVGADSPPPLAPQIERELRRQAVAIQDGGGSVPDFVTFVLGVVCGFARAEGTWQRGTQIPASWGRPAITGQMVRPRQLWQGPNGAVVPVFIDGEKRVGIGRGNVAASEALQWLRAGEERVGLLTNGRQWRLLFAGLDFSAWCEWDIDQWFEEGESGPQVAALRTLLHPRLWTPPVAGAPSPLLAAIRDSRKGQSELSSVLGERVREAVEILIQAHGEVLREVCAGVDPAEIYRAAARVVMRLVVTLFAETRELLPRDNPIYHGSYGLTGLLEELEKTASRGGQRLARSWNGWPRLLALFRLVHQGSHHPELAVPAYGGELFAPGSPQAVDGMQRALSVFETACFEREILPDRDVYRMLERLTRTRVKLRQGRGSVWVAAPVDFSDLSSEYIGILYEGLLDFELKTAPPGDPVIFLAVGNQPALPLSRLEGMDDRALANLLEKMKDTSSGEDAGTEEGEGDEADEAGSAGDIGDAGDVEPGETDADEPAGEPEVEELEAADERHTTRTRAELWARRAVEVGKLARRPRGALTPERRLVYEETVARKARQIVVRVILPGEWYLVRWGGTRKGSGTFYTRPGLAVPTVHRTLRPLAYAAPTAADGSSDLDAPPSAWTPRTPEEILALKVCDPACGSGTFPVAALRYLTDALYAALYQHGRIAGEDRRTSLSLLASLPDGPETRGERLEDELLPAAPEDPLFEPRLKAILRRHVVERCIYGVDLDPLAVELCRLALWIETMDRSLPFSFLDHKIRCGNGLLGAWFDQFQHYPVMAWKNREGGDKGHTHGVHFQAEARTRAIKAFVKERLTPDLARFLEGPTLFARDATESIGAAHHQALATLSRLHALPIQDSAERARIYREELLDSPAWQSLKAAMDLWCACWFWPADELEHAPLPSTFAAPRPETRRIATRVAARKRFFHWELEFPDVFRVTGSGFDALLGNPPWDIAKPNSREFFSNLDPLYRSYGKQDALRYQTSYFAEREVEHAWLDYNADFRAQSNAMGSLVTPFGDPVAAEQSGERFVIVRGRQNDAAHARWRQARARVGSFADPEHPYRHQGSADLNLYKAFLEQAHALARVGGRIGFIVPSGLYSDHGTGGLRQLLLDRCRWEWLFGFENRERIFDIHRSFKFNAVIVEKGGRTEAIRTAFMRRKLEDWERGEALATLYARRQVERFSPRSKSILEIQSTRDLEILEKIYANSVLLGDDGPEGWGIKYATEFHMTNDSKLFPPRPKWEADGYRPDEYSRWLKGDWRPMGELWAELGLRPLPAGERRCAQPPYDTLPVARADLPAGIVLSREADAWIREERVADVALSLYQGRMIWQADAARAAWSGPTSSEWEDVAPERKWIAGQFLLGATHWKPEGYVTRFRIGFRDVQNATNRRTFIASLLPPYPCGNKVPVLKGLDLRSSLILLSSMLSFHSDRALRLKMSQGTVNWFYAAEVPVLRARAIATAEREARQRFMMSLCTVGSYFAQAWLRFRTETAGGSEWRGLWAATECERLRLRALLDALNASSYGTAAEDLAELLRDCDLPVGAHSVVRFQSAMDPKGFWRVDKDKDPELRHTVLTLVAFHDLEEKIRACGGDREKGIEAFLAQNDGEGWMLPETLRLSDYGLGHDERAREHQPVASRLGPRFFDWQLAQGADESWRECHLHARNLLGEAGYQQLLDEIAAEEQGERLPMVAERRPRNLVKGSGPTLFDRDP